MTVYNSANCGSFLQAFAMGCKLREMGHEVFYLKRDLKGTSASTAATGKVLAKALATGNVRNIPLKLRFQRQLMKDLRFFPTVHTPDELSDMDYFILGSDTIWRLDGAEFRSGMWRYWGLEFPGHKVVAYAPSVDGTPAEVFSQYTEVQTALRRMKAIGVRDHYTASVVEECAPGRRVSLVCDPTMLYDPSFYAGIQRPCGYEDFVLVYAFRRFCSGDEVARIRESARQRGKRLVSFGTYRSWCDINVAFDVLALPAFFEAADSVVSNTFHGSVFSILYQKQFKNYAKDSRKVFELLQYFGISDGEIDYSSVQRTLEALRESSLAFLRANVR